MAATTVNKLGLPPTMLNHAAYVSPDAEATVRFNGYRLELTTPLDKHGNRHTEQARRDVAEWLAAKARQEGRDPRIALLELIRSREVV